MKKLLALLLVFLMLFATFTGCSDKGGASSEPADDVTADVVATDIKCTGNGTTFMVKFKDCEGAAATEYGLSWRDRLHEIASSQRIIAQFHYTRKMQQWQPEVYKKTGSSYCITYRMYVA